MKKLTCFSHSAKLASFQCGKRALQVKLQAQPSTLKKTHRLRKNLRKNQTRIEVVVVDGSLSEIKIYFLKIQVGTKFKLNFQDLLYQVFSINQRIITIESKMFCACKLIA